MGHCKNHLAQIEKHSYTYTGREDGDMSKEKTTKKETKKPKQDTKVKKEKKTY